MNRKSIEVLNKVPVFLIDAFGKVARSVTAISTILPRNLSFKSKAEEFPSVGWN